MRLPNPNKLLVEGPEDEFVIAQLVEANGISWGKRPYEYIVQIRAVGGIDKLLQPGSIRTELGERNLQRLGILLDADIDPGNCWQRLRKECLEAFPDLPDSPHADGTIVQNAEGKQLGVWIMPDNQSPGMLETFLAYLVPKELEGLWQYVEDALVEARNRKAPYRDAHRDKAAIHTWLAWQNPPGYRILHAMRQPIFDPRSPLAQPFIAWFRRLYEL
jgi:hypothetical protein